MPRFAEWVDGLGPWGPAVFVVGYAVAVARMRRRSSRPSTSAWSAWAEPGAPLASNRARGVYVIVQTNACRAALFPTGAGRAAVNDWKTTNIARGGSMVRLKVLPESLREHLLAIALPEFGSTPFVAGPPLTERRIAIVSTAGLHRRSDPPYVGVSGDYRVIPGDVAADDLMMSHISANFDRSGFQQDWNVVFPLERLRELAARGEIGSVADFHYSFMGAVDPAQMEPAATEMTDLLRRDGVQGVLLVPV